MKNLLKIGGKMLIFVWAFEQKGRIAYDNQDIFVGWQLPTKSTSQSGNSGQKTFNRYYHLFKAGELDALVNEIEGLEIVESGYDRDNWFVICRRLF